MGSGILIDAVAMFERPKQHVSNVLIDQNVLVWKSKNKGCSDLVKVG